MQQVFDEYAELSERQNEISRLFSENANVDTDMDDLEAELAALTVDAVAADGAATETGATSNATPVAQKQPQTGSTVPAAKKQLVLE